MRMLGKVAHQYANPCGCCPEMPDWQSEGRKKSRRLQRRREKRELRREVYNG